MSRYKVFITKSYEAAETLARGCGEKIKSDKECIVKRTSFGTADLSNCVPAIYHGQGYYCCVIEYEHVLNPDRPLYDLVIC